MMDESIALGDEGERTFDAFFAERFDELSRLAFLLTGASAVADEIAQDACEEVFRRWEHIDHPRAYARSAVIPWPGAHGPYGGADPNPVSTMVTPLGVRTMNAWTCHCQWASPSNAHGKVRRSRARSTS